MELRRGNLVLVGLMGSGKTTLGRSLARRLQMRFVDADHELERKLGVSIATIFEIEGEDSFRDREERVLAEIGALTGIVLATGGGAVVRPGNRERLRQCGTVVYLHAAPETVWARTRHSRNRPLLRTADPLGRLREMYLRRDPLYRETADLVVESDQRKLPQLLSLLEDRLRPAPGAAAPAVAGAPQAPPHDGPDSGPGAPSASEAPTTP